MWRCRPANDVLRVILAQVTHKFRSYARKVTCMSFHNGYGAQELSDYQRKLLPAACLFALRYLLLVFSCCLGEVQHFVWPFRGSGERRTIAANIARRWGKAIGSAKFGAESAWASLASRLQDVSSGLANGFSRASAWSGFHLT